VRFSSASDQAISLRRRAWWFRMFWMHRSLILRGSLVSRMLICSRVDFARVWSRVLHQPMLKAFPRRIINIHPSLLPKFPGLESWKQALVAGETVTGCTVHYVDERIDHGQILAQREVRILPNDTAESLHARIQVLEHELYPAVIAEFCERYTETSRQTGRWPDK